MVRTTASAIASLLCILAAAAVMAAEPAGPGLDLDGAIATLRHRDPTGATRAQWDVTVGKIIKAWKVVKQAGPRGAARLGQALEADLQEAKPDLFFRLNGCALLWEALRLEAAPTIAKVWRASELARYYSYVFYTALDAARTQDARVRPMLLATLADSQGVARIGPSGGQGELLRWPVTHQIIWGAYGVEGLPALHNVLLAGKDPTAVRSAVRLLSRAQHLPSLARTRELARSGDGAVRTTAVMCLGAYGHPGDYDLLVSGLRGTDAELAWAHVYALYEYQDLRAAAPITPLLASPNKSLRQAAATALMRLVTPQSIQALRQHARTASNAKERQRCSQIVQNLLREMGLTWGAYTRQPASARLELIRLLHYNRAAKLRLRRTQRPLARKEFLEALARWRADGAFRTAPYQWITDSHILAVAGPDDIDRLLALRSGLFRRLSPRSLTDAAQVDQLLRHLGRSRYRADSGICEHVMPAQPKPKSP